LLRDLPATADVRSWDAYDLMKVFPAGFAWSAGLLAAEQFGFLTPILPPLSSQARADPRVGVWQRAVHGQG
jgi:hypothetical protein